MSTTAPRLLQVRRSERITPRMVRVTLGGDELAGFGGEGPDRRIKMFFPVPGQERPGRAAGDVRRSAVADRRDPPRHPHLHGAPLRPRGRRAGRRLRAARGPRPGRGVGPRRAARGLGGGLRAGRAGTCPTRPPTSTSSSATRPRCPPSPPCSTALPAGVPALAFLEVADAAEEQALPGSAQRALGAPRRPPSRASRWPRPCARRRFRPGADRRGSPASRRCVRDLRKHLLDERGLDRRRVYATGYWRAR